MRRLLALLCLLPFFAVGQQKAMFSQYMFNGLVVNPAYSSIDESLNITALSRHQWVGFEGAPNTQTVSLHSPVKESNSSFGVILMRDQIGEVITENMGMLSLAQRVEIFDDTYLALGISGGLSKFQANYSQISDGNSFLDPVFNDENEFRGNVGLGLMFFSKKLYAGISSPSFMEFKGTRRTSTSFKKHYIINGGYLMALGENLKFKPNILFKYVNGSPMQMDLNANFLISETLWLGASWRSFDSMDFLAEIQISPKMQIGYSYDMTHSRLASVQKGSHEFVLSFRLPVKGRNYPKCYF